MSIAKEKDFETEGLKRSDTMGGLVKGLAIIEMFGAGYSRLTVAEAAKGSDSTRAAARRCLLTLTDLGYLEHDGKFYIAKARLRRLGGHPIDTGSLAEHARPILAEACERLDEPISLAVLDGRSSLFIARSIATRFVSTGVHVGGKLPGYCTATGRLLLGTLEDHEIKLYLNSADVQRRTPHTLTDPDAIFERIAETRRTGISYGDEELEIGMRAMAVAVYGRNNEVVAAMSLSTSSARVSLHAMKKNYLPVLLASSNALTRILKDQ